LGMVWSSVCSLPILGWPFKLIGTPGSMSLIDLFRACLLYRSVDFVGFMKSHREAILEGQRTGNFVPGVCNYYRLMSDVITMSVGPYWHFTPLEEGKTRMECHDKFHHTMAEYLEAKKGEEILEIGCGYGEIGRQVAAISGVNVTGLTMADEEITGANERIVAAGLESQCNMVQGNYHDLPFGEKTYDKVFGVYTLKYSADLKRALAEATRVLKPGGTFVSYEILVSDKYNSSDPEHKSKVDAISHATCMPPLWHARDMRDAAAAAGLVPKREVDLCSVPKERGWYKCFTDTGIYYVLRSRLTYGLVRVSEVLRITPRGFTDFYDHCLVHPTTDFVECGQAGIITGAVMMVWTKR